MCDQDSFSVPAGTLATGLDLASHQTVANPWSRISPATPATLQDRFSAPLCPSGLLGGEGGLRAFRAGAAGAIGGDGRVAAVSFLWPWSAGRSSAGVCLAEPVGRGRPVLRCGVGASKGTVE
ncbi:hypothetical protein BRL95_03690 [Xanthomonas oryzae pv. oryzae]|nr:hypothetical protein BRL95_03690 [Xanthomonas oryzae pv. oryzae]